MVEHTSDDRGQGGRLDLLKALGDNTRYAVYLELARSARPLSTADVAESLGLHLNTVRPHLERLREVGLLEARTDPSGSVGRPQKLYEPARDAPSLGLEPPVYPLLAEMLLQVAVDNAADDATVLEAGRHTGRSLAHRADEGRSCAECTVALHEDLGFDPAAATEGERTTIGFGHCPFVSLAREHPQVVCSLHRGLMEGYTDELGGGVIENFCDLASRTPCRADVVEVAGHS
ncbi:MAG: helix-turn-helix transcriptional regulator [Microthrixaceae bacterium]